MTDLTYEADVTITAGTGDAGVVFRATQPAVGTDAYRGYYAGLTTTGRIILGKADKNWRQLASAAFPVTRGARYHLRIEATGTTIKVYADSTLKLTVTDATFTTGATGVRVFNTAASFDNISID
ncbi:family 16 glycoside hydrolase [Actinoplanes sp. NPDC049316]|uniref:family 16 glycoside hydrolase n=1 Tax=Actinoplanes sp. NPDC049316 TaxID=3154727 RepID=UPI0034247E0B